MNARALFVLLSSAALAACSSSSTSDTSSGGSSGGGPDASTSGGDAGSRGGTDGGPGGGDGGGGDGATAGACGDAPYVTVNMVVDSASATLADGGPAPVAGAVLTSPFCPGLSRTSDANGALSAQVQKGASFYAEFTAANYVNTATAELSFSADASGLSVPLPPSLFSALIPGGFDATKTAILVGVLQDGGTGACNQLDGVSFTVPGHPEATVTYYSADSIPQPTTGTSTTTAGRAVITGLAAGQSVTLSATKSGCTLVFDKAPYTGHAPTVAGSVTLVPAYLH